MAAAAGIPYYLLVSNVSRPSSSSGQPSKSLYHPVIQYHYADDMPLHLLPSSLEEHVIVLDYDPTQPAPARAQSISGNLAVTGVKLSDAPGAGAAEEDESHSTKMFVLETTQFFQDKVDTERVEAETILVRFKQRNSVLREVLEYQSHGRQATAPGEAQPAPTPQATSPHIL